MKKIPLIFIILTLLACNITKSNEPERAKGIPEKAFWIGGPDGGNWYLVENIHSHRNNAKISIYNDQTGEIIVSKKFILVCPNENQTFITNLKDQINSFDGNKIYLNSKIGKKTCWLQ